MNEKQYNKNFYIQFFFNDFEKRIENIKNIITLGYKEEGLILALCQIDALSNFRYNPKPQEQKRCFKKLLETYSKIARILIHAHADHLYKFFRCSGVHKGRISTVWQINTAKHQIFSIPGILSILETCLKEIKQECLNNNKWPWEL